MPLVKVKCEGCGEMFDNYLFHRKTSKKRFCDYCMLRKINENNRKQRRKKKELIRQNAELQNVQMGQTRRLCS